MSLKKKNNYLLILVVLFLLLLAGIVVVQSSQQNQTVTSNAKDKKLEVATDPNFMEKEGELIPNFPDVPVYPGATLIASAKTNPEGKFNNGYRAKWTTTDPVTKVMNWYQTALINKGWNYEVPNDPTSEGEQVSHISTDEVSGYVAAEIEDGITEIVVDLRVD